MGHTDRNQRAIVDAFRKLGATVSITSGVGRGFPDLVVGYRGVNELVEVKSSKGELNADEERWHSTWSGSSTVVRDEEDVVDLLGRMAAAADAALRAIGVVEETRPDDYLERLRDADRLRFMRRELELER